MTGKGLCIWMTGLSGAGKTTIARVLERRLTETGFQVQLLDGDEIRQGLSPELGFSKADREKHNQRVIFLAEMLMHHGVVPIVPLISPYRAVRDEARLRLGRFVEIYVATSLEACIHRDPKGLYKKALAGQIKDMTGLQDPYEPPISPELEIRTEGETPDQSAERIIDYLERQGWLQRTDLATAGGR